MEIRPAESGDIAAIDALLETAFQGPLEAEIARALRADDADTLELVAVKQGRVVGEILFSPAFGEIAGEPVSFGLALGPLAVSPGDQRRGIGTALAEAGLDFIATLGAPWCMLLGNPAYYSRFGFERADRHGLSWAKDRTGEMAPYFQIRTIEEGKLPAPSVRLHYHTAFDLADSVPGGE